MQRFTKSVGAVDSESTKHSKHPIAIRLFYSAIIAVVGAALLPVIPVAAKPAAPSISTTPSAYTAVVPTRVMDTRSSGGALGGGQYRDLTPAGVPAGATAVVLNVTATNTTAASFLTVFPAGSTRPLASNLNWVAGQTVPNLVEVPTGTGGAVTFFNAVGSVDVVADLEGYFTAPSGSAGGQVALTPARITDTRPGSGQANAGSTLSAGATLNIQVTGAGGVPLAGVSGVILNATVTNTTASSFLTVWPTGATRNTVSNLNWTAGLTVPNRVFVPIGTGGKVSVYSPVGSVDVVIDVDGYFTDATASGATFTAMSPFRIADTRGSAPLGQGGIFTLQIGGVAGVPANAKAVILNVTVTNTSTAPPNGSFLTVYPSTAVRPLASDLNWTAGRTVPNLTVATLGTSGAVSFYNAAGSTDVVVDIFGYFGATAGVVVTANPSTVAANNGAAGGTSTVTATVTKADGTAAIADAVNFTTSGGTSCGTLTGNPTVTDGTGNASVTYHSSGTAGTCTITATEAGSGMSGSTTITQTQVKNTITTTATPASIAANGTATSNIDTVVTNSVSGAVVGDVVSYTMAANPAGACGTLAASSETTGAGGATPTDVYTASSTQGFCTITATEAGTGSTTTAVITQHGTSTNTTAVVANPTSIAANGTSTSTLTATVSGSGVSGITLSWTKTANVVGGCGTLSAAFTTTDATGKSSITYTSSTTAGAPSCTVRATEADSGNSGTAAITQTAVNNVITLAANPSSVAADGTSTSTVTATVTSGVTGLPISGDSITFSHNVATSCGTFTTANPKATDASGHATVTYTSSTVPGFCTVTGTEQAGAPGTGQAASTTINQQNAAAASVVVTATPASIPADGATTSSIVATVKNSTNGAVANDSVNFTTTGAACGTLVGANPVNTNASGQATITYRASTTVGSCSITATEASAGKAGSISVTQTQVLNSVAQTAAPNPILANGTATSTITTTVTHAGTPVAGDAVTYTTSPSPAGACGALSGSTSPTSAGGTVTVTYTASLTVGFCTVTGTEATNGSSASTVITQKGSGTNTVAVTANPTTIAANGTSTSTITATVSGAGSASDPVSFTLTGANCGTLSAAFATTNASGVATVTYTSKAIPGPSTTTTTCAVGASEANGGGTGSATVTQTDVPDTLTVTANPSTIKGDGITTSTITAQAKSGITGAGDSAVPSIVFYFDDSQPPCGTFSNGSFFIFVTPDATGTATTTYTSAVAPSTFCHIGAQENHTGTFTTPTSGDAVITQTS